MPLTPKLTPICFLSLLLLATVSCSSNPNQTSVQPNLEATSPTSSPNSEVEQYFETNNFQIYLCYDKGNQTFYYGVDKRNGAAIALPAYTEEGTGYVATNGDYEYIVTGASLSVYEKGKLILEENVIRSL